MKLLWLALSLICALVAFLTYPRKAPPPPQVVEQPAPAFAAPPVQTAKPASLPDQEKEELEYLRKKEREYQRATNPYFHKEIQPDPPTEVEPEPPKFEAPQRYKDMGLARDKMNPDPAQRYRDMGLARFKMGQEKWDKANKQAEQKEEEKK